MWQRQKEEEVRRQLQENQEEMKLAIEERELQKMAALSQQDSLKDALQCEINQLKSVSGTTASSYQHGFALLLVHRCFGSCLTLGRFMVTCILLLHCYRMVMPCSL